MATGEEIRTVYVALKTICTEASQMLSTLQGEMSRKGFKCLNTGGVLWDTSEDVGNPIYWLPYFLQMVFVSGDVSRATRAIGVQILFDDPNGRIDLLFPVVLCGVMDWSADHRPAGSNNFYDLCLKANDRVETEPDPPFFRRRFADSWDCREAIGYFLRLVALEDRTKLIELVVNPCIDLFNRKVDFARSAITGCSLTPHEFLGESSSG